MGGYLRKPNLIIFLTEEPQLLSSLVHEDSIQLAILHSSDLNGLAAPPHNMRVTNQSCIGRNNNRKISKALKGDN